MAAASRPASTPSPTPTRSRALGAGEILLTSMDRDGTGDGFDLALTRAVADAVPVPVVASGGVGTLDHLVDGVTRGPRLRGARRLDLPLRHLYDPRRPRSIWRRPACPCGSTAEEPTMTDFTLADLADDHRRARPLRRPGDVLHGEAARRGRRALRQEVRRGGGRGGARRGRRGRRGADRRGRPTCSTTSSSCSRRAASPLDAVMAELERRTAQSGLAEKARAEAKASADGPGRRRTVLSPHRVFTPRRMGGAPRRHAADADRRRRRRGCRASTTRSRSTRSSRSTCRSRASSASTSRRRRGCYDATRTFLGTRRRRDALHHRHRRLGRGRQVDHGARAARAAPPLAEHAEGRPDRDRRLPPPQRRAAARRADGAEGLSRRATTCRRCSPSSPTSRPASATSRRRSIRTSSYDIVPGRDDHDRPARHPHRRGAQRAADLAAAARRRGGAVRLGLLRFLDLSRRRRGGDPRAGTSSASCASARPPSATRASYFHRYAAISDAEAERDRRRPVERGSTSSISARTSCRRGRAPT